MTWNYRVIKKYTSDNIAYYAIHEVYYDKKQKIISMTENPVTLLGDNIKDLKTEWVMVAEAFKYPIVEYKDIKFPPEPDYTQYLSKLEKADTVEYTLPSMTDKELQDFREEERRETLKLEKEHNKEYKGLTTKETIKKLLKENNKFLNRKTK